jgi:hypothetical protein
VCRESEWVLIQARLSKLGETCPSAFGCDSFWAKLLCSDSEWVLIQARLSKLGETCPSAFGCGSFWAKLLCRDTEWVLIQARLSKLGETCTRSRVSSGRPCVEHAPDHQARSIPGP